MHICMKHTWYMYITFVALRETILTQLFHFFTNWTCLWRTVGISLSWWKTAINITPTSLLFRNDIRFEWVITESCCRYIRRTSPTFQCFTCKKLSNFNNYVYSYSSNSIQFNCICITRLSIDCKPKQPQRI